MDILKSVTSWIKKPIEIFLGFLVPEDTKIKKLLGLSVWKMRELLPKSPVNSEDIFVLFDYGHKAVRQLVKAIKYKNNRDLRKKIAILLYEDIVDISSETALFEGSPPILVPMPMSKKEKRKKGFNQCEELVREIKRLGGDNIEISYNTLKKVKETKRQTKLSREERLTNVENSMKSDKDLANKNIIVLDDVYTTGASLIEARRALSSAGARHIIGLFIAH